ncbi:unnamed protein product [Sphagnum tenellum]
MFLGSRDPHTQSVLEYHPEGPITVETTWTPAISTSFREILDNALDEMVAHGHGDRLEVTYDPETTVVTVTDNGRGIPIGYDATHGTYKATLALTHTKAGRNFGDRGETRGLNGVGASVVNFCSEYFDVTILRDGQEFTQRFTEGDGTNDDLVIEDPIIMPSDSKVTGTSVTYKPSSKVFHDMRLPESFVAARMTEVALCYPAIKVFYNGKRIPSKPVEEALFPQHQPIVFAINDVISNFKSRFWLVPQFLTDGSDYSHSLVNAIPMFNGGVHIDAFKRGFFSGLLTSLEKESKKRKLEPNKNDISDGLLIFNITQMKAPNFDSQSKSRLINEPVGAIIRKKLDDPAFFKDVIKRYPDWIEAIYERCKIRTQKKTELDIGKAAKKSKREKVEDLQDACGADRSKCICFLTEGKSALAGITDARDPDVHGGLALRGKPMNVREKLLSEVMANQSLTDVMKSIGLFPGQRVNRHSLRKLSVITTSDYLRDSSREYSIYVCSHRAIPSVTDGLKHVQRMALWMLRNKSEKIKTFALTGMLGAEKIHVHGEKSSNDAISLLAAPYKNNVCLIEGLGQFGSRIAPDGEGIGAPRYTEVRRSKVAEAILYRDLDLVPLEDNYDGSAQQPMHFLPLLPLVLLNGVSGIAVGWSTDILPRSLKSIIEATKAALMDQPIPTMMPHYAKYNIDVKPTNKPNQWEYSGHATVIDSSTIKITELPPGMAIENFRKNLIKMEDNDQIQSFADRSTETIDITVKMKRGSVAGWTEKQAIDFFKIKEKTTERIVVIDWKGDAIRTYDTAEQLVIDFANWRLGWYTKRFEKLLADAKYELCYWQALQVLFEQHFPTQLGGFSDRTSVEQAVTSYTQTAAIVIDDTQLDKIVNLPTYKWTMSFAAEVNTKIEALEKAIAEYIATLESPTALRQVYLDEIEGLKSFKG